MDPVAEALSRAAYRTKQSVMPPGGRQEGIATQGPESLAEHWAKSALSAAMLPGDVFAGRAQLPSAGGISNSVPYGSPEGEMSLARAVNLGLNTVGIPGLAGGVPANALGSSAKGIRAYHGSPHDFDRFDMSRIGTGEGAQAYGHGLYFAENPLVAESYDKAAKWRYGGQNAETIYERVNDPRLERGLKTNDDWSKLNAQRGFWEKVILGRSPRQIIEDARLNSSNYGANELAYIQSLNPDKIKRVGGNMYEVNINAHPEQFLDWDKGGADLYKEMARNQPSGLMSGIPQDMRASQKFAAEGIPGIKYLDQGSRTAGEGSRNYVVFDDKLIDILKKYGLGGLGLVGAAQGEQNASATPF